MARSEYFYSNLKKLGCVFVDKNYEPSDLSIVVTLVGTITLERSLSGKQTVALGHIWFKGIPGTISLEKAIEILEYSDSTVNSKKIIAEAQDFLSSCLNYKTLTNARGIGTGKPSTVKSEWLAFYQEMNNLIKELVV
jgi:hypothetical protein